MNESDFLTLSFGNRRVPRHAAEKAGRYAYQFFSSDRDPQLNPLTMLSLSVRRYDDTTTLSAEMRRKLVKRGFLRHGENIPLARRMLLPGIVSVSMVVPELDQNQLVGEYLEEPFKEVERLAEWYEEIKQMSA
jgi:hypothetical protein